MLAKGIAAAMRSDETPPFAQLVAQLFESGSIDQKAAMLNVLLSSVSHEQRAQLSSMIPGLGPVSGATGSATASTISPAAVQTPAQHVEHQGDRAGGASASRAGRRRSRATNASRAGIVDRSHHQRQRC